MAGTGLINVIFGFIGFLIVFVSAYTNNSLLTSMIRGLISFVSFFIIAYLFRWMFHYIMSDPKGNTMTMEKTGSKNLVTNQTQADLTHIKDSIDLLNDEEAELAARYIREMLNEKEK
ncbi:hypothetical protein [Bacillus pinisoli]|uniref:hypothetical protein n=1 Tax=Bacillus pinisoli TaxID=2901866 RepID=UPI001FF5EBCE|nr:hypothetical protein [Bacillus pinisoli]